MSEITHCYYCIYRHCTREGYSVSTRKCQEKQSTYQNSTERAQRGRRDVQGSFCPLQGEGLQLHCTCYTRGDTETKNQDTQDDLFNLVELTYDIQDYTHRMFLVPELGVVLGHRAMLQEFRAVLCTKGQQPQLVSYDTTYNLGDFYVSPLLFRHTLFEGAPVMPVAFLIHEKRTQFAHEVFMDFIAKEIPEIAEAPFVTDGEENIIMAITKRLPQGSFTAGTTCNLEPGTG